ncbi:hypothetical protein [Halobacteriovorax sp. HLS]|uniref:hypothetical protein n=1 Tax=Halobacteriovorax sp. HLS TaxID=2234000 RepID=UPI000FD8AF98|nr:hypothetical protein [Halobacteriovorax sp. HLS]
MWKFVILSDLVSSYAFSPKQRELLSDILALRFEGYRKYYGEKSIPQDCFDFIGTHLVIATEEEGKLIPQICLRSITNKQTENYLKDFPFIEHMFVNKKDELSNSCQEFINSNETICYTNNYTINPNLSADEKLLLSEMMMAFYYLHHQDENINTFITAASDKFKVYNIRLKQGYNYINNDCELSTFAAPHIMNEKFRAMAMTSFSLESRNAGKRYKKFYDEIIDFRTIENEDIKKTA